MTDKQLRWVAVGCLLVLTGCVIYTTIDGTQTSRELREAANKLRRSDARMAAHTAN